METSKTIKKLATNIPGFDHISMGGLPAGRTTLISGSAGSAKTMFAAQFIIEGIQKGEHGVFVTFEESAQDIRNNLESLNWPVAKYEEEGKWIFVDASPGTTHQQMEMGDYDFNAIQARIKLAAKRINASRISLDSMGAVFNQFDNPNIVRRELFSLSRAVKSLGITAILTTERQDEYGAVGRFGVEEFVADNVIILRNILHQEKRRRTIEILKYRGTNHHKGEHPFTIIHDKGIVVIPLSSLELKQKSTDKRVTSGSKDLDNMCGGGFFRDSIILASGPTGTGKTLMATEFLAGGVEAGDKSLVFAFEESHEQLFRNARGWGIDFDRMEQDGKLKVVCMYPESAGLEDHLLNMKNVIEEFKPKRIAVDSLSALERVSSIKGFREFVIALTSFIKEKQIMGLFTATAPALMGGASITEAHISTITDSIILLRYVEINGEMRRGLTVLKMRGSKHEKNIREFIIDNTGMHLGKPFSGMSGIIAGNALHSDYKDSLNDIDEQMSSSL
ncbi:MAG: circadian clock protein KaiC [Bacteroidota bacterium]